MKLLIVSATEMEIAPLVKHLVPVKSPNGRLNSYSYKKITVDVLITGIGMTATAFYLGKTLNNSYDLALNFGLAGSFQRDMELGTVINVTNDTFSELGAEDGEAFLQLKELGLEGITGVMNTSAIKNPVLDRLPKVKGITVNNVHGNEKSIEAISGRCKVTSESMEGAAFLMACVHEGVPNAQVRAISNYVERRDKSKWNIPLAIDKLNKTAIEILDAL